MRSALILALAFVGIFTPAYAGEQWRDNGTICEATPGILGELITAERGSIVAFGVIVFGHPDIEYHAFQKVNDTLQPSPLGPKLINQCIRTRPRVNI